jgi:hypothetical protein
MPTLLFDFGARALRAFASIGLLLISRRILGLLYVTKMEKIGWF